MSRRYINIEKNRFFMDGLYSNFSGSLDISYYNRDHLYFHTTPIRDGASNGAILSKDEIKDLIKWLQEKIDE